MANSATGSQDKLSLAEVVAIGIGGMVGGGIFAVLGVAIETAGHAVAIAMALGGVVALLTGISYARLGLAFRDDGGSFTYVEHAFGSAMVAGVAGWLLVAGYVGTLALYATTFGAYGAALISSAGGAPWLAPSLAILVVLAFLAVNLVGAKISGRVELIVVSAKVMILALFGVAGVLTVRQSHMLPVFNQGITAPLVAAGLIFVAYEGFELIPNAVEEMRNPQTDLKRGVILAIVITTVIYVGVSLVALGNLSPDQVAQDKEYVLAVAARPTLGNFGFVLIGVAALMSTASAINATLFGAARLAMVMAADHALPRVFSLRERTRDMSLGLAGGPCRNDLGVPARGRSDGDRLLRERGVSGDLCNRQPVRVAPAGAHRDQSRHSVLWRPFLGGGSADAPLAHVAVRSHQPRLYRRILPRRGRSGSRPGGLARPPARNDPVARSSV